jgi:hypothetical protein
MIAGPPTNHSSNGYVFWRPIQASRYAALSSKLSMELFTSGWWWYESYKAVCWRPIVSIFSFAEGVIKALPVALQINAEAAGQNEDKLVGQNIRSRVDVGLVVFGSLRNNGGNAIHQFEDGGN